ncbi:hypothetical protein C1646_761567 [Rhizophagus diaphanus]|nr:hypothetical protein C1646_761567 [Rhizophagus diaphanus] [Rhizophagus sp. MUCL 43196]
MKLYLLDKNHFPKLHATLDGTLKEMKKLGIDHDAVSSNNPKGLLKRIFLWICLLGYPQGGEHYNLLINQFEDADNGFIFKKFHQKNDKEDVKGKAEPNADICKCISMRLSDCITKEFYLGISTNTAGTWHEIYIACGINVSEEILLTIHGNFRLTEETSDINSKTEIQYDNEVQHNNEVQCDVNIQHREIVLSGFSKALELLKNKNKRPLQKTSTNKNMILIIIKRKKEKN